MIKPNPALVNSKAIVSPRENKATRNNFLKVKIEVLDSIELPLVKTLLPRSLFIFLYLVYFVRENLIAYWLTEVIYLHLTLKEKLLQIQGMRSAR